MPAIEVRPFRRSDRDQLTALVNAHIGAVVPGMSVSVHTVLSDLESRPAEFITDQWVSDRATLVAEQGGRVAAAAHLLRYFSDDRAGADYRGLGEISWFLFWPHAPAGNPGWPDAAPAADVLMAGCLRQLARWGVTQQGASGDLPAPGVYGVPDQWPHVSAVYQRAGFVHAGHTEIIYLARVSDLPGPGPAPLPGLSVRREVGMNGTRLAAVTAGEVIGYIEVDTSQDAERQPRHGGWADVGNLRVEPGYQRRGVATWLLGHAADWLRLARADNLLDYAWQDGTDPGGPDYASYRAFLPAVGFRELTRTRLIWARTPDTRAVQKDDHEQH